MKQVLKTKGREVPRDYKILVIAGGSSANPAVLASGQIAATTIAVPLNFVAEELRLQRDRMFSRSACCCMGCGTTR
ncbi:MAG: hypothetical protein HYU46_20025 [Deltaproteobacteria bacterium]|nr:hypothetical protein [Deltaproteobacteria bacterium]MBI2367713.1 hypothetical protein [Deltaproteobacteria bacterium]